MNIRQKNLCFSALLVFTLGVSGISSSYADDSILMQENKDKFPFSDTAIIVFHLQVIAMAVKNREIAFFQWI